jgi:hypothetical protein
MPIVNGGMRFRPKEIIENTSVMLTVRWLMGMDGSRNLALASHSRVLKIKMAHPDASFPRRQTADAPARSRGMDSPSFANM